MYCISDQQMDFILDDIRSLGIGIESLQQNLLDHICIIIEQGLKEDGDFDDFYSSTIRTFYKKELREIEEEAVFLLTFKNPFVVLSRSQFFLLLFSVFIGPFIGYDVFWMIDSGQTPVWNLPFSIWAGTLVYSLFPLLVLLVLLLTPDRLDPVIPRKSKILIGRNPFIRIMPAGC